MSNHNKLFGRIGEERARQFLEAKGLVWVASNFFTRWGEVDLIMTDKNTVVFVEVKHRRHDHFGEPEEAVTKTKRDRMIKSALTYIQEMDIRDTPIRFDVVSLGPRGTRHYRNAFYAGGNYYY